MLMHLLWYWANAGTKIKAEVASREEMNLQILLRRRMVEGGGRERRKNEPSNPPATKDGRRNAGGRSGAGEPSERLRQGTSGVAKPKDLRCRSVQGSAPRLRIRAFNELKTWTRSAWGARSVKLHKWLRVSRLQRRNMLGYSPTVTGHFCNYLRSVSEPYIKRVKPPLRGERAFTVSTYCSAHSSPVDWVSHYIMWEGSLYVVSLGSAVRIFPTQLIAVNHSIILACHRL